MRIAFVGLSSPLFYDYKNAASKAPSDLISSPNPVLDSPFGLMLLFDEIWFACRSLCPENMRNLPYVKFLDEEKMLPNLENISLKDFQEIINTNSSIKAGYDKFQANKYDNLIKQIVKWDAAPDNHTHRLKLGEIEVSGNSLYLDNLLFDMEVVKRLKKSNVELITNSYSQSWFENIHNPIIETKLAETMVINEIPNYLTPNGPYHHCIEEARDDTFLKDFRKWIVRQSKETDEEKYLELKNAIDEEIQIIQDKIFLKQLNPNTQHYTTGKIMLGETANILTGIPILGSVISIVENYSTFFNNRNRRWQGFIVSSKNWKK